MRDARAHEAAALLLGAFALRESADKMSDVRWALNRMTAHLAMAAALRGGNDAGVDAAIAQATLLALSNRPTEALAAVDRLAREATTPAIAVWARALRVRLTDDWRIIENPAKATRLEKLAYLRARRASVSRARAAEDLERVNEPLDADFVRIAASHACCVEDGGMFISPAIEHEFAEITEVHVAVNGRPMADEVAALNVRPSPLVGDNGIQVVPWGAWAQFFQRHLAMHVGKVDGFYRHSIGSGASADEIRLELDAGDIVVGLEGWLVESVEQYQSINAFFDKPEMKLTVWGRKGLVTIETVMPGRLFGVELRNHPLKGWIED